MSRKIEVLFNSMPVEFRPGSALVEVTGWFANCKPILYGFLPEARRPPIPSRLRALPLAPPPQLKVSRRNNRSRHSNEKAPDFRLLSFCVRVASCRHSGSSRPHHRHSDKQDHKQAVSR